MFAQDEILVISAVRNRFGDWVRLAKVEHSALYRFDRASGDSLRIYGRIFVSVNACDIVEDRGRWIIRKIEVSVVGKVDDCCAVRLRRVSDEECGRAVLPAQREGDRDGQVTRKAHVAVGRNERHDHAVGNRLGAPHFPIEADGPPVQGIASIILGNFVGLSIQVKLSTGDSVCESADGGPHKWGASTKVIIQSPGPQHYVAHLSTAVGHADAHNSRAVSGQLDLSVEVFQCVQLHRIAGRVFSPRLHRDCDRVKRRSTRNPPRNRGQEIPSYLHLVTTNLLPHRVGESRHTLSLSPAPHTWIRVYSVSINSLIGPPMAETIMHFFDFRKSDGRIISPDNS